MTDKSALDELREWWFGCDVNRNLSRGLHLMDHSQRLQGILKRLLAEPPPQAMTDAERALCDAVRAGDRKLIDLMRAVFDERHPKPRTLADVEKSIVDWRYHNPTANIRLMQELFDERRKLLDNE